MPAAQEAACRILSLDGGGAKGFYTLGVLNEIEAIIRPRRLHEYFDVVFGTSTGAIIAALLALGYTVAEVHRLYRTHVPTVMKMFPRNDDGDKPRAIHLVYNRNRPMLKC